MGKNEIWFTYSPTVLLHEFDVHKVKGKKLNGVDTTVVVSQYPEFHGEDTLAHRLFGWAIAMYLCETSEVALVFNSKEQFILPDGYNLK